MKVVIPVCARLALHSKANRLPPGADRDDILWVEYSGHLLVSIHHAWTTPEHTRWYVGLKYADHMTDLFNSERAVYSIIRCNWCPSIRLVIDYATQFISTLVYSSLVC